MHIPAAPQYSSEGWAQISVAPSIEYATLPKQKRGYNIFVSVNFPHKVCVHII